MAKGSSAGTETEVSEISDALDVLLTELPRHQTKRAASVTDAATMDIGEFLERTPAQRIARELRRRPVDYAIRMAIKALGERLHEIGGVKLMRRVLDEVAARDPSNEPARSSVLDSRWGQVGDWNG